MKGSRRIPIHKKRWSLLTPRQKLHRELALQVLSEVRKNGNSLSRTSRELGISSRLVIRHTNAFKKEGTRKWVPKKYDRISRVMRINENGKESSIEIADSRRASLIGRYHSAIGSYLNTGNEHVLKPFRNKRIRDIEGRYHVFETDPERLREISERIEEPEFYEVYSS